MIQINYNMIQINYKLLHTVTVVRENSYGKCLNNYTACIVAGCCQ